MELKCNHLKQVFEILQFLNNGSHFSRLDYFVNRPQVPEPIECENLNCGIVTNGVSADAGASYGRRHWSKRRDRVQLRVADYRFAWLRVRHSQLHRRRLRARSHRLRAHVRLSSGRCGARPRSGCCGHRSDGLLARLADDSYRNVRPWKLLIRVIARRVCECGPVIAVRFSACKRFQVFADVLIMPTCKSLSGFSLSWYFALLFAVVLAR